MAPQIDPKIDPARLIFWGPLLIKDSLWAICPPPRSVWLGLIEFSEAVENNVGPDDPTPHYGYAVEEPAHPVG